MKRKICNPSKNSTKRADTEGSKPYAVGIIGVDAIAFKLNKGVL